MNSLIEQVNELAVKMHSKEQEAIKHEQDAKICWAEQADFRKKHSELNANINDAKIVQHLQSAAVAANAAQAKAEEAAKNIEEMFKEMKEQLAKIHTTPESNGEEVVLGNRLNK